MYLVKLNYKMMRLMLICSLFLFSCGYVKHSESVDKPTSEMTNFQTRKLYKHISDSTNKANKFIIDSLKIEAKNKKIEIVYNDRYFRDSFLLIKYQIKFDYKRFNDSLQVIKSIYRDSLRTSFKIKISDNKKENVKERNKDISIKQRIFNSISTIFFVLIAFVVGVFVGKLTRLF